MDPETLARIDDQIEKLEDELIALQRSGSVLDVTRVAILRRWLRWLEGLRQEATGGDEAGVHEHDLGGEG
jgi:hypothetical protein